MTLVITRATKQAARYTDAGGRERCSGCRFFMPQGTCGRIIGPVSPRGWCKYYSMEAVQRWQPQGAQGIGGIGPSLDLGFMSGTLDPRLTFTRASTATYFNTSGTMQTAAINAPRFDYDPVTQVLNGLLIEEQRTNINPFSVAFSSWSPIYQITETPNAGTAPDGTATMTRIAETAVTDLHYTSISFGSQTASVAYTFSVYARAVQTRYLQLICDDNTNGVFATFDLQAGAVSGAATIRGTGTSVSAAIQSVGNGVYRCSVTATVPGTTIRIGLLLSNIPTPGYAPSYPGNTANGLLVWGAQVEVGAFPTSYIPTAATAVTRSSDVCTIQPAQMGFYTPPGGSWMMELIPAYFPGSFPRVVFRLPDVAGPAPIIFDTAAPGRGGQYDGVTILTTVNGTPAGLVAKVATTATALLGTECLNGGSVASASLGGGGYPTLGTTGVGFLCMAGASPSNTVGYIRRVRYWPRVLSNAELQSVTL